MTEVFEQKDASNKQQITISMFQSVMLENQIMDSVEYIASVFKAINELDSEYITFDTFFGDAIFTFFLEVYHFHKKKK